ncbi:hypothetical protein BV394_05280 [Brevirhabdus pacifica]|uniref:Uncharacterized protein n=2 Tax=Brevirhabdus pacifica TaxID=1267768 RepID=A0A1U7DH21_9RHOB|nr:FliH/SctL family protein [Brevirhabdus pacifica]APX89199.1 hypothetical protein BV394_05280 [Brevirhabdus pacifica]PJJ86199.1 flagellar biosynthesis/type III secretory pathway protein FliH [Brevirhabdus pacifica]
MTLFARNFDHEREAEEAEARRLERARHTEEELQAAVALARAEGREEGRMQGMAEGQAAALQSLAARQTEALEALGPAISDLLSQAGAHRQALEAQSLDFALSLCERLIPELLRGHSRDRTAERVRRSLRLALGSSALRIHLAPTTLEALGPGIQAAAAARPDAPALHLLADPELDDGDMRAAWDNGQMEYSYERTCGQILDVLRRSRLVAIEEAPQTAPLTPPATKSAETKRATGVPPSDQSPPEEIQRHG